MTVAYGINGGSEIPGVVSSWQRKKLRTEADGTISYTNTMVNTWRLPLVSMTNFETLRATQGATLTSLETNDPDDRDAAIQYTTVNAGLISGRQAGINMQDVSIEFTVDLNSEV